MAAPQAPKTDTTSSPIHRTTGVHEKNIPSTDTEAENCLEKQVEKISQVRNELPAKYMNEFERVSSVLTAEVTRKILGLNIEQQTL